MACGVVSSRDLVDLLDLLDWLEYWVDMLGLLLAPVLEDGVAPGFA